MLVFTLSLAIAVLADEEKDRLADMEVFKSKPATKPFESKPTSKPFHRERRPPISGVHTGGKPFKAKPATNPFNSCPSVNIECPAGQFPVTPEATSSVPCPKPTCQPCAVPSCIPPAAGCHWVAPSVGVNECQSGCGTQVCEPFWANGALGESCDTVCQAQSSTCFEASLTMVNNAAAFTSIFQKSTTVGNAICSPDAAQAVMASDAWAPFGGSSQGLCTGVKFASTPTCDAKNNLYARLCCCGANECSLS